MACVLLSVLQVHGGLGTTVEALRTRKPVAVTGILLLDQRFWGDVCWQKGVGPRPVQIDAFYHTCVEFVDKALEPTSSYAVAAAELTLGTPGDDGIETNVAHIEQLLTGGLQPVR